jgi:cobalt-zinc-cadmium efflux system outer membrane protein
VWPIAERRRPSLQTARRSEAAARGGLVLARRERWPVPAVAIGSAFAQNQNNISALVGVSLPVPLFDRNQGAISGAEAGVRVSEYTLEAELAEARNEVARACAALASRKAALERLEKEAFQRIPALRRMAEEAYTQGSGGILELLDSFRSLKEIRLVHLRQLEMVKLEEAQVIFASGLDAS